MATMIMLIPGTGSDDYDDDDDDDDDCGHVETGTGCDDPDREEVLTCRQHDDDCDNTGSQWTTINDDDEKKESDDVSSNPGALPVVAIVECDLPERTSICCAEDVPMPQVVQVLPLRRSNRLSERRQRQQLHVTTNTGSGTTATTTSTTTTCDTELSTPDLLGSTFVNGRRRSSRHLSVKTQDDTTIPCSGCSQRSRRSR